MKDLEKALPSAGSISNMVVKDYVQALVDDNHVTLDKIGNVNWYWSFPSDVRLKKEEALSQAQGDHDKATTAVKDLQQRIEIETDARAEDEMLLDGGSDRKTLMALQQELKKELEALCSELASYKDNDPKEFERRKARIEEDKVVCMMHTDQILSMEGWIRDQSGGDKESLHGIRANLYGQELDPEEGLLRELS